jgi:ATP-dependent DNA helicase RecQ
VAQERLVSRLLGGLRPLRRWSDVDGWLESGGYAVARCGSEIAEAASRLSDYTILAPGASHEGPVEEASSHVEGYVGRVEEAFIELASETLRELWGSNYDLRPGQSEALRAIARSLMGLHRGIVMAVYPTGYGKSLIFQLATRILREMGVCSHTIILSPLRALISDQAVSASRRGFRVASIHSGGAGNVEGAELIYVTPESFKKPLADKLAKGACMIVFDEAHSITRWGFTFRPLYLAAARTVAELRKEHGIPVLLLTATAPPFVVEEVLRVLGVNEGYEELMVEGSQRRQYEAFLDKPIILRIDPVRKELVFDVIPAPRGDERLALLKSIVGDLVSWSAGGGWVGIVYTGFALSGDYGRVPVVAGALRSEGYDVIEYHGRMSESLRRRLDEAIKSLSGVVVVATKAFGMGIDVANVRWIVHYMPSDGLLEFYQEAGRAGRDGREARVVVMYNPEDLEIRLRMARMKVIKPSRVLVAANTISLMASSMGLREFPLPLRVFGKGSLALRILDPLRLMGYIDYEPIEDSEGLKAVYCKGSGPYYRVYLEGFGVSRCRSPRVVTEGPWASVMVVDDGFVGVIRNYLSLRELALISTLNKALLEDIEALKNVIEEFLYVKNVRGLDEANVVLRDRIRSYLESYRLQDAESQVLDMPTGCIECGYIGECSAMVARAVVGVARALGEITVTGDGGVCAAIAAYLSRELEGVRVKCVPGLYRRLLRIKRGSLYRLMDYGFLIVAGDCDSMSRRLSSYPYALIVSPRRLSSTT